MKSTDNFPMRIKFQTFLYCLLFCVTLCEESTVRIGRGFRTPIYSLRIRGNEDLPNPWLHPRTCGDDYSNNTVICDPDEGLSVEFKSRFNKWSSISNYRIFLAVIGNLDYNNVGRVYEGDDISTKYYADHLIKKWSQEFAGVASNITVDVLILAWLNDDANLFDIVTSKHLVTSTSVNSIVYDMDWLNYQQFWWFGGISRMSAIEQALTCGLVQADMYISNGVSHINSPYSHWYKNRVKPSSDWYYYTLYWLYFIGLNVITALYYFCKGLLFVMMFQTVRFCLFAKTYNSVVLSTIATLKQRTATPNYYVRVYKSEYCAICREKMVQLSFLAQNGDNNSRSADSGSGGNNASSVQSIGSGSSSSGGSGSSSCDSGEDTRNDKEPEDTVPLLSTYRESHGITGKNRSCIGDEGGALQGTITSTQSPSTATTQVPDNSADNSTASVSADHTAPTSNTADDVMCVDPVILSCGHIFGCECISRSFRSRLGFKCPICQKPALHSENQNAQSATVATLVMRVDAEDAV